MTDIVLLTAARVEAYDLEMVPHHLTAIANQEMPVIAQRLQTNNDLMIVENNNPYLWLEQRYQNWSQSLNLNHGPSEVPFCFLKDEFCDSVQLSMNG